MAGNIPGLRLVRCPKCLKVLAEIANVPVYRCGECGTTLRAKNRAATVEAGASSGPPGSNGSQSLPNSNSLNGESVSAAEQPALAATVSSSDLTVSNSGDANNPPQNEEVTDHGKGERVSSSDHTVSNSSDANHPHRNEEGVGRGKGVGQRSSGNPSPTDQLSPGRGEINDEGEREPEERSQVKQGHPLDENTENFIRDSHCSNSNNSESEEDVRLAAGSSHSYYGSSSSPDRSQRGRLPSKYLLLSKRTFRHKKVLDSVDSNRNEKVSRPRIPSMGRGTTFGSEDFHSVQNWIGSETDEGASKSLSKDLLLHSQKQKPSTKLDFIEPDHVKILRKVDELRDELSGFITRTVEGKGASDHLDHRFSQVPISNRRQTEDRVLEKLQCKEKKASVLKSYCRPVSGGSPFVICYNCWKLLQLPADFLVTQKRFHKLQCGYCSKVLQFSFRPKARTSHTSPIKVQHNNNDRAGRDPMSYSDDYGISFPQSYSSEAEPEPVLHVSRNSSYSIQGSDGQRVGASRLHRLMGYSSASELLFRPGGVSDVGQSSEPDTPQFCKFEWNGTGGFTPNSMEIEEEEEPEERLRNRRRGFHGLLKKGVRELSQGLESVKLKRHSNG